MKIEHKVIEVEKKVDFSKLIGITFDQVERNNDCITFKSANSVFNFYHEQACCENVYLADICGELSDLQGSEILSAYESSSNEHETQTWTFYTARTMKGSVTFRWIGESNGCYSERAELYSLVKEEIEVKVYSDEELKLQEEERQKSLKEHPPWWTNAKLHRCDGPAIKM